MQVQFSHGRSSIGFSRNVLIERVGRKWLPNSTFIIGPAVVTSRLKRYSNMHSVKEKCTLYR
jgi:hypothetical protein